MAAKKPEQTPDALVGICQGILSDGRVVADEARFLLQWLTKSEEHQHIPAIKRLRQRVEAMLADGAFTSSEGRQLAELLNSLVIDAGESVVPSHSPSISPACTRPPRTVQRDGFKLIPADQKIFDKPELIDFSSAFCFTGIFAFGERHDCERVTADLGGIIKKAPVSGMPCYVVVGSIASPDWAYGNYGTKIEKGMQLRTSRKPTQIIHEDQWAMGIE